LIISKETNKCVMDLFVLRGFLNEKFSNLWNKFKDLLEEKITTEMISKYSNRNTIYNNSGYKFAVYIIEYNEKDRIPQLSTFPKELCKFNIGLNDKFHPKTYPKSVVENAIRELKEFNNPKFYSQYGLTMEVLNEAETIS
jgi:hypothetical protein